MVTGNVTDVAPGGTVTEAGTDATALFVLLRFTVVGAVGAGDTMIVPVELVPPETEAGEKVKLTILPGGGPWAKTFNGVNTSEKARMMLMINKDVLLQFITLLLIVLSQSTRDYTTNFSSLIYKDS